MVNYGRKIMTITFSKTELNNKAKTRSKLEDYIPLLSKTSNYSEDEIFHLILSAIRTNEWGIISPVKYRNREKYNLDIQRVGNWIKEKVIPNTVTIKTDEADLLKLMVFSLAMPYKMLKGETRATMSKKGGRGEEKYFQQIFPDVFKSKIGEIAFKKFAKQKFGKDIILDWDISTDISTFKSDIVGSREIISIKSTDTLESIWAEAPKPAKYGIFVKVALPKDFFMKILAHISSLKKLLGFVKERLDEGDKIMDLVRFIEETAYEEEMAIKAYVCGFYKTSENTLKSKGLELPYLGEVHEDKHLVECHTLRYSPEAWNALFSTILPCD